MSQKQWGNGYHKGKTVGKIEGISAQANLDTELKATELIWAVENMALHIAEKLSTTDIAEFENLRFLIVSLENLYIGARNIRMKLKREGETI